LISITSGLPGAGKTLWTIAHVEALRLKDNRDVYYHGIKDLTLRWHKLEDPLKWYECPTGAIIVIDECQAHFPTRSSIQKVPEYVERFATHRHNGHDLFLITQHPGKLDSSLRKDTEVHRHLMRKFGATWSTVHQWQGVRESCDKTRKDSIATQWRFPKESYAWYKSSEVHTHKLRVPAKIWALLLIPCIVIGLGFYVFRDRAAAPAPQTGEVQAQPRPASSSSKSSQPQAVQVLSAEQLVATQIPRIHGIPHTAPRYDELTKPVRVPVIVGCVRQGDRSWCFTQQGNKVYPPAEFVQSYLENGMFQDFERGPSLANETPEGSRAAAAPQATIPTPSL
jgi:hypothetical protein